MTINLFLLRSLQRGRSSRAGHFTNYYFLSNFSTIPSVGSEERWSGLFWRERLAEIPPLFLAWSEIRLGSFICGLEREILWAIDRSFGWLFVCRGCRASRLSLYLFYLLFEIFFGPPGKLPFAGQTDPPTPISIIMIGPNAGAQTQWRPSFEKS